MASGRCSLGVSGAASTTPAVGLGVLPIRRRPVFTGRRCTISSSRSRTGCMSKRRAGGHDPAPEGDAHDRARGLSLADYADWLDGLVLQGGSDVAPEQLRRGAAAPEWTGDRVRDRYEIDLLARLPRRAASPCSASAAACSCSTSRFGGTLLQDIATQRAGERSRTATRAMYDRNLHEVDFVPGSRSRSSIDGARAAHVNTIHHQAIKDLGPDFVVEARWPCRRHGRGGALARTESYMSPRCSGTPSSTVAEDLDTGTCSTNGRCCSEFLHACASASRPRRRAFTARNLPKAEDAYAR